MPTQLPKLAIANAAQWRQWLAQHTSEPGVFVTVVKEGKETPTTSLTYQQALDEALCYGWIDSGGGGKISDVSYLFRFTPRREKSSFSPRNVGFVERLEHQGRIEPAGRAAIDAAKAGGRWGVPNPSRKKATTPASSQSGTDRTMIKKKATKAKNHHSEAGSRRKAPSDTLDHSGRKTRSGRPAPSYRD